MKESLVNVQPTLKAADQPLELVQPSQRTLDNPPVLA
jgi:hypothetical protein